MLSHISLKNSRAGSHIFGTPVCLVTLNDWLIETSMPFKFIVDDIDDLFWETQDEINGRIICGTSNMVISMEFKMLTQLCTLLLNSLQLEEHYPVITMTPETREEKILYGIYKKRGVEEALIALQKLDPSLTEDQFVNQMKLKNEEYSSMCIEKTLYKGPERLISSHVEYINVLTGYNCCKLTMPLPDILPNLFQLQNLITMISYHQYKQ